MRKHELRLTMCAPVDDDRDYFAELSVDSDTGANYTWAEMHLEDVDASADGPPRVENARAVVRLWFDEAHFDVPLSDLVAKLERARTMLFVGESHVPPHE
jgi:hypothetical protein